MLASFYRSGGWRLGKKGLWPLALCRAHLLCPSTYCTQVVTAHVLRSRTRWVHEVWVRLGRFLSPRNPRNREPREWSQPSGFLIPSVPGPTRPKRAREGSGLRDPPAWLSQPKFAGRRNGRRCERRWVRVAEGMGTRAGGDRNLSPLAAVAPGGPEPFFSCRRWWAEACGNGTVLQLPSSRRGRRLLTWAALVGAVGVGRHGGGHHTAVPGQRQDREDAQQSAGSGGGRRGRGQPRRAVPPEPPA